MLISSPPNFIQKYFNQILWKNRDDEVILTFDDGPHPIATYEVLDVLNKFQIKSIFFCLGKKLSAFSKIAQEISDEGHFVANHSFSHKKKLFLSGANTIYEEIKQTQDEINRFNNSLKLFRPPYGLFSNKLLQLCHHLELKIMMWSLLSGDYSKTEKTVLKNIVSKIKKNSIVVFHDNEKTAKKIRSILQNSIKIITDNGYNFANKFDF